MTLTMLDLCSGFGGASEAMKRHGWKVTRLDIDPRVKPDVVGDLLALPLKPYPVDLLWISPICTEYSRFDQKGLFPNEPEPDHALYNAAREVVSSWGPRFWVIENVRGAIRFWGQPTYQVGPYKLWTNLPLAPGRGDNQRKKHNLCSGTDPLRSAKRGRMPYELSDSVRQIVETFS